ncbi:hypothetical protein RND81_01G208300 [Saponaria officinalis]|uniref:Uncharacterized protein n=1 Tax=Saponaria officinalis TaxID=3572 RepID=A0AAW1NHD2_SAPOF
MWVTTPTLLPLLPITPSITTTTTFTRWRHHITTTTAATANDVSGLGQAVLTALKSTPPETTTKNPNPNPNPNPSSRKNLNSKPEGGEVKVKELNGSDILWALQKASAKKAQINTFNNNNNNNKKRDKKGSDGKVKRENTNRVDGFDNVRPIVVKSEWVTRLDDLDQRLQEFSSI